MNRRARRASAFVAMLLGAHLTHAAPLVPANGRLLVIGQDGATIADYVDALGATETPGGVTA